MGNGLRLITVPMQENETVTVLVLVEAGSSYETKAKNGISHFLEHMCFKGTAKRPTAHAISAELDGLGAQYNAFTSHEYTGYYAKSDAKNFSQIFDIVSDIYLNSTFPKAEIEKEKGVIIEEINMYEDIPQRKVDEELGVLMYGDTPAGWGIAGPRENIRAMTRNDFLKYHKAHYVPKATTIVVAGHVTEAEVAKIAKKIFGTIKSAPKSGKKKTIEKQSVPAVRIVAKKTDQAHLILALRSVDMYHKDDTILDVLAAVLAGGMSSRLFQKLREEMGVAYYVRSSQNGFTDHGYLDIRAGVDTKRTLEVISVLLAELKNIRDHGVTEEELVRTKASMIGNIKLELESSDAFAQYFGGQEVFHKKVKTPKEVIAKIEAVQARDIARVAKSIVKNNGLNLALIGPYEQRFTKEIRSILKL